MADRCGRERDALGEAATARAQGSLLAEASSATCSVGYHRPLNGGAGTWWGRVRQGGKYKIEALATADDHTRRTARRS